MKVHFFNPGYEASVGLGSHHYTPTKSVQTFRHDLSTLPLYYKKVEDKVYVTNKTLDSSLDHPDILTSIAEEAELVPWGWAPELIGLFGKDKVPYSQDEMRHITSRRLSVDLWRLIKRESPELFSSFVPPRLVTSFIESNDIETLKENKWVLKDDFSSSGRGIHFIHSTEQLQDFILKQKTNKKATLYIEPYYNKIEDRGYEFYRNANGTISYLGPSSFVTAKGKYQGNVIQSRTKLEEQFSSVPTIPSHDQYINMLMAALSQLPLGHYEGYLGIDTLVFMDNDGHLKIAPCLEINCRPTMGHLALSLGDHWLMEGFSGEYTILHLPSVGHMPPLASPHPLYTFSKRPTEPGNYTLTPIQENTKFMALIKIFEK
ncbi:hypothetical protein QYZ87_01620 [Porphyromonadaceae bacterium W3.11]|nr:hypothetical protein [Porphyromonadaceae bacterium W3.11]